MLWDYSSDLGDYGSEKDYLLVQINNDICVMKGEGYGLTF